MQRLQQAADAILADVSRLGAVGVVPLMPAILFINAAVFSQGTVGASTVQKEKLVRRGLRDRLRHHDGLSIELRRIMRNIYLLRSKLYNESGLPWDYAFEDVRKIPHATVNLELQRAGTAKGHTGLVSSDRHAYEGERDEGREDEEEREEGREDEEDNVEEALEEDVKKESLNLKTLTRLVPDQMIRGDLERPPSAEGVGLGGLGVVGRDVSSDLAGHESQVCEFPPSWPRQLTARPFERKLNTLLQRTWIAPEACDFHAWDETEVPVFMTPGVLRSKDARCFTSPKRASVLISEFHARSLETNESNERPLCGAPLRLPRKALPLPQRKHRRADSPGLVARARSTSLPHWIAMRRIRMAEGIGSRDISEKMKQRLFDASGRHSNF